MNKNAYLTKDNNQEFSKKMLEQLKDIGLPQHQLSFEIDKAALLVLDMQNYFLEPKSHAFVPSAPIILAGIQTLIKGFSASRRPIIFTQHVNEPKTAGMMTVWWKDLIHANSSESAIYPGLDTSNGKIIQKERYDAFWKTDLEEYLQVNQIRQLVITGVMTNLCCESTARSAFIRDYEVFFTVDGTATYHEQLHYASLANLAHGFAMPVLCTDCIH